MKVIAEGYESTATAAHRTITFPSEYANLAPEDYIVICNGSVFLDGAAAKQTGSFKLLVGTNGSGYYQVISLKG